MWRDIMLRTFLYVGSCHRITGAVGEGRGVMCRGHEGRMTGFSHEHVGPPIG